MHNVRLDSTFGKRGKRRAWERISPRSPQARVLQSRKSSIFKNDFNNIKHFTSFQKTHQLLSQQQYMLIAFSITPKLPPPTNRPIYTSTKAPPDVIPRRTTRICSSFRSLPPCQTDMVSIHRPRLPQHAWPKSKLAIHPASHHPCSLPRWRNGGHIFRCVWVCTQLQTTQVDSETWFGCALGFCGFYDLSKAYAAISSDHLHFFCYNVVGVSWSFSRRFDS